MTYYAASAGGWVYQDPPTRAEAEADEERDKQPQCKTCDGNGVVDCETCDGQGELGDYIGCEPCGNMGFLECEDCDGSGHRENN